MSRRIGLRPNGADCRRPCASSAAPSTPASRPRRGSTRNSTPSTPSATPARPTSPASGPRAGCWLPDRYDDGGFSGGTLERPALRRLLADIEAGTVDVVVVYKIDRLSPLADGLRQAGRGVRRARRHLRLGHAVFNTTTSMGRLTLNILLSFAQFEREVIGERIRDKFAASRARGMWMGGKVPLGYDVRDRKLVVNEAEAARVRRVFRAVRRDRLGRRELCASCAPRASPASAASLIDKGDIYKLLNNRTYVGEAVHKGQVYPGEHEAIIPPRALGPGARHPAGEPARAGQPEPEPVAGAAARPDLRRRRPGDVAHPHAAARPALPLLRQPSRAEGRRGGSGDRAPGVGGRDRGAVIDQLRALLRQPEIIVGTWRAARAEAPDLTEAEVREALAQLDPLWEELFPAEQARIVRLLVERVEVGPDGADIRLRVDGLASLVRELRPQPVSRVPAGQREHADDHGKRAAVDQAQTGAQD